MVESRRSACPLNRCSLALSSLNGCRQFRRGDLPCSCNCRSDSRQVEARRRRGALSCTRDTIRWLRVFGRRLQVLQPSRECRQHR
jgi:hypothetical protein